MESDPWLEARNRLQSALYAAVDAGLTVEDIEDMVDNAFEDEDA